MLLYLISPLLFLTEKLVSQLLMELDELPEAVVVVATADEVQRLDAALLRPGRLEQVTCVPAILRII